jgi:hypothetical protein
MRIPSTSDLCQAHSNRAYDKMEVISDHIHELMDLYEWIFNLRAYLASLLAGYVTIGTDQTITGKKTFENLKAHVLNIANATEVLNEGYITTGYYNDSDPALIIHFTAYDDNIPYETRLYLVSRPGGNPYFVIPPTNADDDNSAVRLDYLRSVLATLNDGSAGLADRIAALENKMDAIYPFDSAPTESSSKGVTSGGVFDAIQDAINSIDIPEIPDVVFPVATTEQKGIVQIGNYLIVNDGLISIDVASLKEALGLGGSSSVDTWTTLTATVGVPAGRRAGRWDNSIPWCNETTASFIKGQIGTTNSSLTPTVEYGFTDTTNLTPEGLHKGATIGTTITCKNTSTNVVVKYVPVRTVGYLSAWDVSMGGNSEGGLKYGVTICAFYRKNDYTLTAADIAEINAEADEFLSNVPDTPVIPYGYTVTYDTGALS